MGDARAAVRGFQAEREAAVRHAVEADAKAGEIFDRLRGHSDEAIDDRRVAEPVARSHRVEGVQRRTVIRPERRRHSALRPERRALGAERDLREDDDRPRRQLKRRHQSGDARADDDGVSAISERRRGHSASIRSTARRAGAAMAGSIVTSPSRVSSARRIFLRVMRFICGQSAQGRTNSMSG